jgi:site-specific DNA-methyltransferase (adenine-specific)
MKPVPLFNKLVKNSTKKGDLILDLFGGSGTTLITAEQIGRRCNMMEYDPRYVDVIIDRWEKLTGQTAELIDDGEGYKE